MPDQSQSQRCARARFEKRDDDHGEQQCRQHLKHLSETHEQGVDPAAVIAGERTDRHPDHDDEKHGDERNGETGGSTIDNAGKHVTAEIVGAERRSPVLAGALEGPSDDSGRVLVVEERAEQGHQHDAGQQHQAEDSGAVAQEHPEGLTARRTEFGLGRGHQELPPTRIRGSIIR